MFAESVDPFTGQAVPPVPVVRPPAAAPAPGLPPLPRRTKAWLQLPPRPPGASNAENLELTKAVLYRTVEDWLSKRKKTRAYFAASGELYLGINAVSTLADLTRPHLILATSSFSDRWDSNVHLAVMLCNAELAAYYAKPAPEEVAKHAFRKFAQRAPYKAILDRGTERDPENWGKRFSYVGTASDWRYYDPTGYWL
jgi:hypothetical protein